MRKTFFDEEKPCENCYILVNDLSRFQCRDCGAFFDNEALRREMRKRYGECWEQEYNALIGKQKLARRGKGGPITRFESGDGDMVFVRYFYE